MELFAGIKTFIFMLSAAVLQPVLLLLAALSVWIFFECGRLLADWVRRKRRAPGADTPPLARYRAELTALLARPDIIEADIQNLLQQHIQRRTVTLRRFRLAARIGPALGLIGTLVPMGTALASLGQGDLSVMTSELVVAYTTTVVGLVIGSLAYLILTIRHGFVEDDIRELEYLTERLYHEVHAQ